MNEFWMIKTEGLLKSQMEIVDDHLNRAVSANYNDFLTGIKLPSSIIGMLLLTLFLKLGWIKLQWVQGLSDFLVANLGFFFVPPGVALMLYFDVIEAQFWPIVIATVVSTVLVLVVTGWVHQLVRKSNGIFRK